MNESTSSVSHGNVVMASELFLRGRPRRMEHPSKKILAADSAVSDNSDCALALSEALIRSRNKDSPMSGVLIIEWHEGQQWVNWYAGGLASRSRATAHLGTAWVLDAIKSGS